MDAQPEGEYGHWTPVLGHFPVVGDRFIYFEAETEKHMPLGETEGFTPLEAVWDGAAVELYDCAISGLPALRPNFLPILDGVSRTVFFEVFEGCRIFGVLMDGVSVRLVESVPSRRRQRITRSWCALRRRAA